MKPKGKPIKWSHKVAYVIGLITTDGSLSKDGYHIDFTSKDTQLLKTFKKCLGINNRITKKLSGVGNTSFRVQFGNVILYRWLIDVGLIPNKSKTIGTLKIPNQYFFHFLRGHLDGDGNIRNYQDPVYPKSERLYIRFCSGSLKHIQWLRQKIMSLLNIRGFITDRGNEFLLIFAKRNSLILLPHLYPQPNLPCLRRKFRIAKKFLK